MPPSNLLLYTTLAIPGCAPHHANSEPRPEGLPGFTAAYEMPSGLNAIEEETSAKLKTALSSITTCGSEVRFGTTPSLLTKSQTSSFPKIRDRRQMVFISDEESCSYVENEDMIAICGFQALQFNNGKIVNNFAIAGLCMPESVTSQIQGETIKLDISKKLEEEGLMLDLDLSKTIAK